MVNKMQCGLVARISTVRDVSAPPSFLLSVAFQRERERERERGIEVG